MAVEIKLPSLGEGVDSGDVLELLVAQGDVIEKDQGLVEMETDKATVIVPSDHAGKVVSISVGEGDTVEVGQVIMTIEASGAAESSAPAKSPDPEQKTPQPQPEPVPSPATPPPSTPASTPAPVSEQKPAAPATPPPASTSATSSTPAPVKPSAAPAAPVADLSNVAAGPAIRRFAREVGVDLRTVAGTGENNRITRDDVLAVVRSGTSTGSKTAAAASSSSAGGQTDGFGNVHIEKMPKIRQAIARKMHESWSTVPRVTNFDDADVTKLEAMRQNSKEDYAQQGIKLTSMPFLIKAIAMSLKHHPVINASVDMDAGQIIYKDYVNIGIAVDTERGLVVPSIRNADKLSIGDIAKELMDLASRVRENNFSMDDLKGGTFTISNLGAIGGTYSTPIVNTPETSILLVGRSRKMPIVVENDEVAVRLMMPLSLSYDHRLVDGGAAARFLNEVIGYLEAPSRLLLAL
jgi:pyruvate/2-oxoglutarate dehydrogenase complex dihydrolipoamide acyltransferase (E2) component